jgi:hypothetical protein
MVPWTPRGQVPPWQCVGQSVHQRLNQQPVSFYFSPQQPYRDSSNTCGVILEALGQLNASGLHLNVAMRHLAGPRLELVATIGGE